MNRREVLLGERLRGRHQRRLVSVADRLQHRVQRHHCLAAAHLAHQQPLHRRGAREILGDRLDGPALVAGQLEGKSSPQPAPAERLPVGEDGCAAARAACRAATQERQLRQQQLLERQAPAARLQILRQAREVHRRERARPVGQSFRKPRRCREGLDHVGERILGAVHERQDLGRADAVRRRVVRHGVAVACVWSQLRIGRGLGGRRVVGDAEAAATVGLAVQQQARAGRVALGQPRLVEERRPHRPGRVEHARLDQRSHASAPY